MPEIELSDAGKRAIEVHVRRQLAPIGGLLIGLSAILGSGVTWVITKSVEIETKSSEVATREKLAALERDFVQNANKLAIAMGEGAKEAEVAALTATAEIELHRRRAATAGASIDLAEQRAGDLQERVGVLLAKIDEAGTAEIAAEMLKSPVFSNAVSSQAASAGAPTGAIVAWWGNEPPVGWEVCRGQAIKDGWDTDGLRKALPNGKADRLPDFRGYFLRGADGVFSKEGSPRADHPSAKLGTPQEDRFESHAHRLFAGEKVGHMETNGASHAALQADLNNRFDYAVKSTGKVDPPMYYPSEVQGGIETRPVNYSVDWIIRVN